MLARSAAKRSLFGGVRSLDVADTIDIGFNLKAWIEDERTVAGRVAGWGQGRVMVGVG